MQYTITPRVEGSIEGFQGSALLEQLFLQRGITSLSAIQSFLYPDYERDLHDPFLFRDMPRAVERIYKAITSGEVIGIFGDHDVDGVSATTLLVDGLESMGAEKLEVYVPDKLSEGHGLNKTAIEQFDAAGVTLCITVDCGVSNNDEVVYANTKGIDVIITDHHHAPDVLPEAHTIINPQVPGAGYPFKELCGTAVVFKVLDALYRTHAPEKRDQLKWWLDLVGVSTIADCMALTGENRVLATYGLLVLSKTRREGYKQLIRVGRMNVTEGVPPEAEIVAFYIAPRLNAAGRMSHAREAYELLREKDAQQAKARAEDLEKKNNARKKITETMTVRAEKDVIERYKDDGFLILHSGEYPVGIIGIIAGRLADKYSRPVGVFTEDGDESRGSFRSVEGVHVRDALAACQDVLVQYGGHAQAAGAVVATADLATLRARLNAYMQEHHSTQEQSEEQGYVVDSVVTGQDLTIECAQDIARFAPFGEANAQPLFLLERATVIAAKGVGATGAHLKMTLQPAGTQQAFDAIAFRMGERTAELDVGTTVDVLAHIEINEWMQQRSVQLKVVEFAVV